MIEDEEEDVVCATLDTVIEVSRYLISGELKEDNHSLEMIVLPLF